MPGLSATVRHCCRVYDVAGLPTEDFSFRDSLSTEGSHLWVRTAAQSLTPVHEPREIG